MCNEKLYKNTWEKKLVNDSEQLNRIIKFVSEVKIINSFTYDDRDISEIYTTDKYSTCRNRLDESEHTYFSVHFPAWTVVEFH